MQDTFWDSPALRRGLEQGVGVGLDEATAAIYGDLRSSATP